MKKIFSLVFILFLSTSIVAAKEKNYSINFGGVKYNLLYSVKSSETGGYLNEYYKNGETYNRWSEMIGIHHFPNAYSPIEQVSDFKKYLGSIDCPSSLTFDDENNSAMIDFILINDKKLPIIMEFNIFKYVKSEKCGSVAVQYAKRYAVKTAFEAEAVKRDFEKTRKKALKNVEKFKVQEVITEEIDKLKLPVAVEKELLQDKTHTPEDETVVNQTENETENKTENTSITDDNKDAEADNSTGETLQNTEEKEDRSTADNDNDSKDLQEKNVMPVNNEREKAADLIDSNFEKQKEEGILSETTDNEPDLKDKKEENIIKESPRKIDTTANNEPDENKELPQKSADNSLTDTENRTKEISEPEKSDTNKSEYAPHPINNDENLDTKAKIKKAEKAQKEEIKKLEKVIKAQNKQYKEQEKIHAQEIKKAQKEAKDLRKKEAKAQKSQQLYKIENTKDIYPQRNYKEIKAQQKKAHKQEKKENKSEQL